MFVHDYNPNSCLHTNGGLSEKSNKTGARSMCGMQTCCCSRVCVMKFLNHRSPGNIRSSGVEINNNREM